MKKLWVGVFVIIVSTISGYSQQLPLYSQFSENIGLINPSAVHSDFLHYEYDVSFGLNHRSQWVSVPGAPLTSTIRGEYLHQTDNRFNLLTSAYLTHDQAGQISTTGLYGRISVIGNMSSYQSISGISAGLLVGVVQYRVGNASEIAMDPNDPFLLSAAKTQVYPDIGFGVSFHHQFSGGIFEDDRIQVGLSAPQLFGLNLQLRNGGEEFNLDRVPHFYSTFQFTKYIGENKYFELSTWGKYVSNVPAHVDARLKYKFSEVMYFAIGASTAKIGHVEIGLEFGENIQLADRIAKIAYSYQPGFGKFLSYFGAWHEITIGYSFLSN